MNTYITSQSGDGKIERALSNLSKIESGIGGLPQKYRNTENKKRQIRVILSTISELEKLISALKEIQ